MTTEISIPSRVLVYLPSITDESMRNKLRAMIKTTREKHSSQGGYIARQLRLRNIGGIIIVDFIDMLGKDHQQQVVKALARGLPKTVPKIT